MEAQAVAVMQALGHPMRVRILTRMNAPKRRLSPRGFCDETGASLSTVSYHFRCLRKARLIRLVDEQRIRGSVKHIYEANDRPMAWAREYECLPGGIKQAFAATALREGVEAAGRAVDKGTFEARPDSHLSWNSIWVDEKGWSQLTSLFDQTLEAAMRIQAECASRMPDPERESAWVASYFMSTFPSPNPPSEA